MKRPASNPAELRFDLDRTRVSYEMAQRQRVRMFDTWIRLEVSTDTEREARARLDKLDERLEALRNRIARLEAEVEGKRWLRPA